MLSRSLTPKHAVIGCPVPPQLAPLPATPGHKNPPSPCCPIARKKSRPVKLYSAGHRKQSFLPWGLQRLSKQEWPEFRFRPCQGGGWKLGQSRSPAFTRFNHIPGERPHSVAHRGINPSDQPQLPCSFSSHESLGPPARGYLPISPPGLTISPGTPTDLRLAPEGKILAALSPEAGWPTPSSKVWGPVSSSSERRVNSEPLHLSLLISLRSHL